MRYLKIKEKYLVSKVSRTVFTRLYSLQPSDYSRCAMLAAKQANLPFCGISTADTIH